MHAASSSNGVGLHARGSFATIVYRSRMAAIEANGPAAAIADKTSLAAAVDAARSVPAEAAGPVLAAARQAFMASYHATALSGALVLALLAALAWRMLRGVTAPAH